MRLGALQPAYFPTLNYYWKLAQCDICVFADHLRFSKGSTINRSAPLANTLSVLRIPILHNDKRAHIATTQTDSHSDWRQKHLRTLHHLFHQWPFGYYYLPLLDEVFRKHYSSLGDFLWSLHQSLLEWLHLPVQIVRASELPTAPESTLQIVSWSNQLKISHYITEKEAIEKGWINREILQKNKIRCVYFQEMPSSHLLNSHAPGSILTFLMQFGPEAGYIIRQYLPNVPQKEHQK